MDDMYNPFSLKGKTILVTGASSGIGRETAIECSKLGANVVITGRNKERLQETFSMLIDGDNIQFIADLTNNIEMEELVKNTPVLNGVVSCAGVNQIAPFGFWKRDKMDFLFETNYFAPVTLLQMLVKKKKIAKDSSIVLVSSIGGVEQITIGNGLYGASKSALNSAMKYMAKELAPKKIRVNSVNPGMVNTKLIQNESISEEQLKKDIERYPLKRYGEPIDIAHGIIFLLSDASSWMTGHPLVIDGGCTI